MDFRRVIGIIVKRKWIIVISMALTSILVYGVTRLIPSRWMATVRVITPAGSALTDNLHKLTETTEPDGISAARIYAALARSKEVMGPAARTAGVDAPLRNLAERIDLEASGPRMYELRYYGSDAVQSRNMANALADNLIAQNRSHNSAEALRTVKILERQLQASEAELLSLQKQYDKYCLDNDIIPGDFLNQVKGVSSAIEIAQTSMAEAKARIAQNQARLSMTRTAPRSPEASEPAPAPTEPESRLSKQVDDLDSEIRQMRRKYNDSYPDLQARLDERKQIIQDLATERRKREQTTRANPAASDAVHAVQDAISADEALIESDAATIAARQAELDRLKRSNSRLGNLPGLIAEKSENRSGIAARLNTAKAALDVAERQNPLSVLEYVSETNPPINTTSGRSIKLVALGAFCAFLVVTGLAIVAESMDRRLKTVQEADELLPARVVAAIPQARDGSPGARWARVADLQPMSPQSEAYRFLGQHLLSVQNRPFRSLMALSARSGQGNTRMMSNLAITLAQAGQTVILIDANLRHPMLHEVFDLKNDTGLTDILGSTEPLDVERVLQPTTVRNLRVLTSGIAISNPWELFSSHRLEEFRIAVHGLADYVLFDTPSALAYTDTLSLSTIANAALLCVRAVDPLTGAEHRLGEMFALSDVHILGSVLMDAPPELIGSYEHDFRDPGHAPINVVPALEPGLMPSAADASPAYQAAHATDTAHSAYAAEAAELNQEVPMDTAFEVTEPRLTVPTQHGRQSEVEDSTRTETLEATATPPVEAYPAVAESTAPIVSQETKAPALNSDPIREEVTMTTGFDTPPGGFPKSIHGYNVGAVDDYVRKINGRLESLLSQIQSESSRAEQGKRLLEQMTAELETMRRRASDAEKREISALDRQKRSEEESVRLSQELKEARERSRNEVEAALADVRNDRDMLLEEERRETEALIAEARRSAAAQIAEAQRQIAPLQQEIARLTAELSASQNRPAYGLADERANGLETASQREHARGQIDLVVNEVRREAEEARARAESVYREHEERVRAMGEECEALVQRIKEAVEAQLTQLPTFSGRPAVGLSARPALRTEESDDKRGRDTREWRSGDWRNAS